MQLERKHPLFIYDYICQGHINSMEKEMRGQASRVWAGNAYPNPTHEKARSCRVPYRFGDAAWNDVRLNLHKLFVVHVKIRRNTFQMPMADCRPQTNLCMPRDCFIVHRKTRHDPAVCHHRR
jgi:hypothetical protein